MSTKKPKSKVFDAQLFKRLMHYIKPYRGFFILALTTVIGLAVFGALRPKVLQLAIDQNIEQKFEPGFLNYMLLMLGLLVLEVTCNLLFIYYASWLGQSVVRDIRIKLFKHILGFKMKYFEEIKAEALKLGISDVHMGNVEIGTNALSTYFSLIFENADAFGRQWGGGSEYQVKSAEWKALFKRISEEPSQVYERVGADLIYEQ